MKQTAKERFLEAIKFFQFATSLLIEVRGASKGYSNIKFIFQIYIIADVKIPQAS